MCLVGMLTDPLASEHSVAMPRSLSWPGCAPSCRHNVLAREAAAAEEDEDEAAETICPGGRVLRDSGMSGVTPCGQCTLVAGKKQIRLGHRGCGRLRE